MRHLIESQFSACIIQWDEPTDDLGGVTFSALQHGRMVVADSLPLFLSALREGEGSNLYALPLAA